MAIVQLNLAGGSGGNSPTNKVYTAPNGVVCTNSTNTYSNGSLYYTRYLFDNVTTGGNYMMTSGSTSTITINLSMLGLTNLQYAYVYPWYRSDTFSNFSAAYSPDGSNWYDVTGGTVSTVGEVQGSSYYVGFGISDPKYVRFSFPKRSGTWNSGANEIDLYYDNIISVTGISLNKTTDTILKGNSDTLVATISPSNASNQNVNWSSDNTAVATVSTSGVVLAVNGGTANIKATSADNGAYYAVCAVTVPISVTGIVLDKTSVNLNGGLTSQLTPTISPANTDNKNVTWSTSDGTIATVSSSGLITANTTKYGTCTITCTVADGSGVTATCSITVYILVTGVTLDQSIINFTALNSTYQLVPTVNPSGANNKNVTWACSDLSGIIATVSTSGLVTSKEIGTCMIVCTTAEGSFTFSCVVNITVWVTSITLNTTNLSLVL